MVRKRKRRIWLYVLVIFLIAVISFVIYFNIVTKIDPPSDIDPMGMGYELDIVEPGFVRCNGSWIHNNKYGLTELYIEGTPLELGTINGLLSESLIHSQEDAFVEQIKVMIPSESYLKFLKYFIGWFNKDLDEYIKEEYLLEIYGVSAFASENYGFIGPKYDRILNYHAAHDIGHALQNMNLVECTAMGVWDERSADSSLVIGRNFDFYVGDEFAKNKIIAFVNPDHGYKFASITWAGMIGVVSGMNEKGLSITLNSAKSDMPLGARTPVSIIAREILQYASNIEEAMDIASARKSFVSESFLIGSSADHKVVVIEKSIDTTILYDPDTNYIILTNHFQSDALKNSQLNIENIENETSPYRFARVEELLHENNEIDYLAAAKILRDQDGLGGKNIGNGNEKAINQLIAHHSIIFKPESLQLWISTAPWQMGSYLCYDLDSIFDKLAIRGSRSDIFIKELQISADTAFMFGEQWEQFKHYKLLVKIFESYIESGSRIPGEKTAIEEFMVSNPNYFQVYNIIGQYFQELEDNDLATKYYNLALTMEVSSTHEEEKIIQRLKECRNE
jgi:isopenicillin-N N-acyltransferase-like protein